MRIFKAAASVAVATTAIFSVFGIPATAFTLSNGPGDGSITVGVDGFGSFGSAIDGEGTANARYNPIGRRGPAETTFESGVAIRFADGGSRTFLTSGDIGGSGD